MLEGGCPLPFSTESFIILMIYDRMESGTGWVEMCDNPKEMKCCSEWAVLLVGRTKASWISYPLTEGF